MIDILKLKWSPTAYPTCSIAGETERRVLWSLYIAERWCSSGFGLRCRMDLAADSCHDVPTTMDESTWYSIRPGGQHTTPTIAYNPGILTHMVNLVSHFTAIQDLNRQIAIGGLTTAEIEKRVADLADKLQCWHSSLPSDLQMTVQNLGDKLQKDLARDFAVLHLTYHHFSTLLHFNFLESYQGKADSSPQHKHVELCKQHASSFSNLLRLSHQMGRFVVEYPMIGHMTVVSSSVLVHTLLFGDVKELPDARKKLDSNFNILVQLQQWWPCTEAMVGVFLFKSMRFLANSVECRSIGSSFSRTYAC